MDLVRWFTADRTSVTVAVAALMLSAVTWLTTRHSVREARRQAGAAEIQAQAATAQAAAAERSVAVAQEQVEAARGQIEVAEQAIDVAREQAKSARDQVLLAVQQLEYTERVRREQMRPFVFADLRPDTYQPELMVLVVHNQGQTVARNVRVTFDPPLKPDTTGDPLSEWRLSTLAPGAQMTRPITSGRIFYNEGIDRILQRVTVEAEDASGPIETLSYEIDLKALGAVGAYGKTIYHVVQALEKIAKNTASRQPPQIYRQGR